MSLSSCVFDRLPIALLLLALLAGSTSSCSTNAKIRMADGTTVTGGIVRSTYQEIVVRDTTKREFTLTRAQVRDIDHPGLTAAIVGTVLMIGGGVQMGVGVAFLISAADVPEGEEEDAGDIVIGALGAAGGGLMFMSGALVSIIYWVIWSNSTSRADAFEASMESPTIMVISDPLDGGAARLGVGWRF